MMRLNSNHIKRTLVCLLLCVASHISFSQETKKFNFSFAVSNAGSKKYLKQIDSVSLQNGITGEITMYRKLTTKDSLFRMNDMALGKYRIVVYQKAMFIPFVNFAVCTFCRTKVNMVAYASTSNKDFGWISVGPHYEDGFKQLSNDFLSGLSKEETKTLKKFDNKLKVKCFITADERLSDILFEQADLPEEIKKLVLKGFEKTKAWRAGIANGKATDDYILLSVSKIVD